MNGKYCGLIYIMVDTATAKPEVKIGYTKDLKGRFKRLNESSGRAHPLELYAIYRVSEPDVDKRLHKLIDLLNPNLRVNKGREFYMMMPENAYSILEHVAAISGTTDALTRCDSTFDLNKFELNSTSAGSCSDDALAAIVKYQRRAQGIFKKCNIAPGSKIVYKDDPNIVCIVVNDDSVKYCDEILTLNELCKRLNPTKTAHDTPRMFRYKGIMLREIRDNPDTYTKEILAELSDI